MTDKIKFHLDENANKAITEGLRRRKIDVTTTVKVGWISASDEEQLLFAHSQHRVIFTQDRDFLKLHYSVSEHSGIVYCIKESRSIGEILRGLILIWEILTPEEILGKVEYI